jgi:hypothetical protein
MFRFLQNRLFNQAASPRARRSAGPVRKRLAQLRVESLESRSMLAFTVFATDTNYGSTLQLAGTSVITNSYNHQNELAVPQVDLTPKTEDGGLIPIPSEPWVPETKPTPTPIPPANSTPPGSSTPPVPDKVPEEPTDPGGMIDLGPKTDPEVSTDPSTYDDATPREMRSVMQLLAALKYPVEGSNSTGAVANKFSDVEQHVRRLESVLTEADGGAVSIAVSEVADELDAARTQPHIDEASLLEISVQMDRSAGRFQAFEVLTLEQPALPAAATPPTSAPPPPANPAAVNFESGGDPNAQELPTQTSSRQPTGSVPGGDSVVVDGTAAVATADEKSSSTWSLAIALVTFGFVLQLLRERRGERLPAKAAAIWQSLLAVTFWQPRRRAERQVAKL